MASEPPSIKVVVEYLAGRSEVGLKNFRNIQLNKSANSRKQIFQIAEQWIEERALELFTDWLIVHGAELVELLTSPTAELRKPEEHFNEKLLTKKYRYDFWRSEQRHARRRGQ